MSAVERWRAALEEWAVPEEILAAAPESPWGPPADLMRRRGVLAASAEPSATAGRALEALPEGGQVLDVGVGGGGTSLSLAGRAARITGVDSSEGMLRAFAGAASEAGGTIRTVHGRWPDVADQVEPADVVVCGHVLYNVPEVGPFVRTLDARARRRVVLEITDRHPLAWMNDLWMRFYGLERPTAPTADDAVDALAELGFSVGREDRAVEPGQTGFERRDDAVSLVRRRLCLPADRDPEIADALGDRLAERNGLWSAGPGEQVVVTLWWDRPTSAWAGGTN